MLYPQIDNTLLATAIGGVTLLGLLSGLAAALINRDTSHQGGAQHLRTRCASAFGTKRTSNDLVPMSAYDPERTSAGEIHKKSEFEPEAEHASPAIRTTAGINLV